MINRQLVKRLRQKIYDRLSEQADSLNSELWDELINDCGVKEEDYDSYYDLIMPEVIINNLPIKE